MKYFILLLLFLGLSSMGNSRIIVTNGLSHEHDLSQTEVIRGVIKLKNVGEEEERFIADISDMQMSCHSGAVFLEKSTTDRSNADWITLSAIDEVLEPGESFELQYELRKPDRELKGSYWSMIMVTSVASLDTTKKEGLINIAAQFRYAVQIISNVSKAPDYDLEFDSVFYDADERMIQVNLFNPTIELMRHSLEVRLFNQSGKEMTLESENPVKLYPGSCRTIRFQLSEEEGVKGKFDGVVIVRSENQGVFGYNVQFDFDE